MDIAQLLAQFSDPEVIKNLSASQRMMGGLAATVLGMGITFAALIILQFVMVIMEKFTVPKAAPVEKPSESLEVPVGEVAVDVSAAKEEELVAVLTTAIAMKLQTASSNIIIRNVEKVEDTTPAWNRAGITEQMNSRF